MKSLKLIKNITVFSCIFSSVSNIVAITSNCIILPFVCKSGSYSYTIVKNDCGKHSFHSAYDKKFLSNYLSFSCNKCILNSCIECWSNDKFLDLNV
jgi:hypothetical protein